MDVQPADDATPSPPNPGSAVVVAVPTDPIESENPPISDDFNYWPYSACTLGGYAIAECTVCKAPLEHLRATNPGLAPFFCALCGFVDCRLPACKPAEVGALSAKHVHDDYLHKWGNIVKARTLFIEMLRPFDIKTAGEDDLDALSLSCALWNAARVMKFESRDQEGTFYHRLRMNPYETLGLNGEEQEGGKGKESDADKKRSPTLMEMGAIQC